MTIRIIGTASAKHIDNFLELLIKNDIFYWIENESKYLLIINNKESKVFNSLPTLKQNIEVWEAFGLIEHNCGKFKAIASPDLNEIIYLAKKNLLIKAESKSIQQIRNAKLLEIEYSTRAISQKELNEWKVGQVKGDLTPYKIKKEISNIEIMLSKDKKYLAKAREVLYGYINKEL